MISDIDLDNLVGNLHLFALCLKEKKNLENQIHDEICQKTILLEEKVKTHALYANIGPQVEIIDLLLLLHSLYTVFAK
jgi:hypothetical protein